ncbi:sensor domain-containing diguanylate cyclase [Oceanospirillum linum]|uniref:diguanylate cyclase n=1 Tax=Oceanospirillum linum TaxID=966 RepID=A0A1T1H8F5_OCELI|nr:sensor domain-containing diguanylate cyclase [Oceanospirillum linum]OOV86010.1 hypothetical protein BTA35_0216030 [Oceanospirillum linum]SEG43917.1 diguanylate cyclase (GGDEF) domain-containing protein [Oleiphilus messinensis]SMP34225.1 diguanylate cyclase (GGDEF) domain-containing protein [Oceanospirillum linum]
MSARYSFSSDEINEAINILEHAIVSHRSWYESLLEGLVCHQPFSEQVMDPLAHTKCGFGCWYYRNVSEAIRTTPEFSVLESTHKEVHDVARDLVLQYQQNQQVSLEEFRTLNCCKAELDQLLGRMHDSIVEQQNSFDPLTGLINRRSLGLVLDKNHAQSIRNHTPYVLAMLDIDFFKRVNDTYGHLAGDEVLKAISRSLNESLREADSVGRYGGEEFLLLLPDTSSGVAQQVLDRLRQRLSELKVVYEGQVISLTVSIGYASFSPGKVVWELVKGADQALYQAKKNGRNQVVAHRDDLLC